jgi:hypothetical protein
VALLDNLIRALDAHSDIFTDDGDLCLAIFFLIRATSEELGTISNEFIQKKS